MIRFISLTVVAVAFLTVGGLGPDPAMAGGYHSKHHHGHYDGHAGNHHYRIPFAHAVGRVIGAFLPHRSHYSHGHRSYRYSGHSYRRGHSYHRGHSYRHGKRHHYRRDHYHAPRRHYSHRPAPRHHSYTRHGSGCHSVSKSGYHHGRPAQIGGTMCYDAYGKPYVVSGSRYVMHYYD